MSDGAQITQQRENNLVTWIMGVLSAVSVALLLWYGAKTVDTSEKVAVLTVMMQSQAKQSESEKAVTKMQLDAISDRVARIENRQVEAQNARR